MSNMKTGACLCGKIKYELAGDSAKPMFHTVCHCLNCRRATGSAFYPVSVCSKDGFKITEGEDHLKTYIDNMTDSGKPLSRTFCGECGSILFNFTPLNHDILTVSAGSLDDFEQWKPDTEQYCLHRAEFMEKIKGVDSARMYAESPWAAEKKE